MSQWIRIWKQYESNRGTVKESLTHTEYEKGKCVKTEQSQEEGTKVGCGK